MALTGSYILFITENTSQPWKACIYSAHVQDTENQAALKDQKPVENPHPWKVKEKHRVLLVLSFLVCLFKESDAKDKCFT